MQPGVALLAVLAVLTHTPVHNRYLYPLSVLMGLLIQLMYLYLPRWVDRVHMLQCKTLHRCQVIPHVLCCREYL